MDHVGGGGIQGPTRPEVTAVRLFIALHFDAGLLERLAAAEQPLRKADRRDQVRWVDPTGIHLTLKFLGEVDPGRVPALVDAVDEAVAGRAAPVLGLGHLGAFPNLRRPRVIWVGLVEQGDALSPLQAAVEAATERLGWERERRAFQPHLTLGRVREGRDRQPQRLDPALERVLAEVPPATSDPAPQHVVALVRSHLSPSGARYEDVRSWQLTGTT